MHFILLQNIGVGTWLKFSQRVFFSFSISQFRCVFLGPSTSVQHKDEHMPVFLNKAISDLVCQSSDAEKAAEHEARPVVVWDRKIRTHKRQETNRALRSAGPTVLPHANTHPIDHLAAVSGEYGDLKGPKMVSLCCITQMPCNNLSGSKTAARRVCERRYRDRNTWILQSDLCQPTKPS